MDPRDPQDLWALGTPGNSGPQDPREITSTAWNSEFERPETLKLKHKHRTFLNYIIGKSQTKAENCVYLLRIFYQVLNQSPPLPPSSCVTVINRTDSQRHLIGYTWIEIISQFLTLHCVKISIKTPFLCYRYTKEKKYFHYIRQIVIAYRKTEAPS